MTTITIDRATVEQALEALEDWDSPMALPAVVALRAALAQQAEPVQEPYAWMAVGGSIWRHKTSEDDVPLYTAPPQRKPLTQEEAATLVVQDNRMRGEFSAAMELIRRTERAHNIKE